MRSIKKIPGVPEILNCPKHGDYEAKYLQVLPNKVWVKDNCSHCAKEKHDQDMKELANKEEAAKIERAKTRLTNNRKQAGISLRNMFKTFDDYNADSSAQKHALSVCKGYVDRFPCSSSLLLLGTVGTGKTLLGSMMVDALCDKYSCEIIRVIDLIRKLKATWSKDSQESEQEIIEHYSNLDLLVIDEIGVQYGSDTEKLFIFDIIDGRYENMLPTVVISNLDVDGLKLAIGERVVDRLREGGGEAVAFNWESYRG